MWICSRYRDSTQCGSIDFPMWHTHFTFVFSFASSFPYENCTLPLIVFFRFACLSPCVITIDERFAAFVSLDASVCVERDREKERERTDFLDNEIILKTRENRRDKWWWPIGRVSLSHVESRFLRWLINSSRAK